MPLPRFRQVEVFPLKVEDKTMICLRDPEGVLDEAVLVSSSAFFVASLLDGKREALDIQVAFARKFAGHLLLESEIGAVVKELDERGFLDNDSYALRRAEAVNRFSQSAVRPFSHAGLSYSADAEVINRIIANFLTDSVDAGSSPEGGDGRLPLGLVVPHIDFERGGAVYASAYRRVVDRELPPLVVVLGVAHSAPPSPFTLTRKNFDTPLGVVSTDSGAVDELVARCGPWLLDHEFAHKGEHSIEFQLIWLKALRPADNFRILPVLCSPFDLFCGSEGPMSNDRIAGFLGALKEVAGGREVLFIASVDFSHVGPKFGMDIKLDSAVEAWMKERDMSLLGAVESGDEAAFWALGMEKGNETNVDALSAVYSLMKLVSPAKGKILAYDKASDPAGGIVSFASLEFGRP